MPPRFRVGLTHDFLKPDGTLGFGDIGLSLLDAAPDVEYEFLPSCGDEIPPGLANDYDALLVLAPRVTEETVAQTERLLVVARFGVGYDNVDVDACTRCDVALTITPDGVRRPVATAAITLLLALAHKILIKDRLTRAGRWDEKMDYMGTGVTGKTLGIIGLGNIGREIIGLAAPFDLQLIAFDPYLAASDAPVELVDLDELLSRADFVCVTCALTPETHHLLDARRLGLMRQTAYLINVARGPIVDGRALAEALRSNAIAGAGLDVFETEPVDPNDPLLELENVIVSPHALCWTDELFRGNGEAACRSILELAGGRVPRDVVNREVLDRESFRAKLARYGAE